MTSRMVRNKTIPSGEGFFMEPIDQNSIIPHTQRKIQETQSAIFLIFDDEL